MDRWFTDRPALRILGSIGGKEPKDGIIAHTCAEVFSAEGSGFPPETVFLCAPFDAEAVRLQNRCRFVAGSLEDLRFLEGLAEKAGAESFFRVGLRLQAPGYASVGKAVFPENLGEFAREIRQFRHLTVRGCFFCGDLAGRHGEALGGFFRAGYEAAKRMTVTIPCAMPYLCYENAVAAVTENAAVHPETLDACLRSLDIVAMQNETAFYAKLYLA